MTEPGDAKQETGQSDGEMPVPADLDPLFKEHAAKLKQAYAASTKAFDVFKQRDQHFETLVQAYQEEITTVHTIAKAVTNPQTARASVPLVLEVANAAFAKAPTTEQTITALIEDAFSAFKS